MFIEEGAQVRSYDPTRPVAGKEKEMNQGRPQADRQSKSPFIPWWNRRKLEGSDRLERGKKNGNQEKQGNQGKQGKGGKSKGKGGKGGVKGGKR